MTLNQIADRITYALNEPLNTLLRENVKFSVKYWRAFLIRNDVAKNGGSDQFLQKTYFDLEKVDKADDCAIALGCTILRTVNKIPKPVRLKTDVALKFVGDAFGTPFAYTEFEEYKYTLSNKFTSKEIKYCTINERIYVFNNTKLKKLAVQAIWADPDKVNKACSSDSCLTEDMEFPMGDDMAQAIINGILSQEFKIQNPLDEEVDIESEQVKPQR